MEKVSIEEMQAKNLPSLDWRTMMKSSEPGKTVEEVVREDAAAEGKNPDEVIAALDAYFAPFTPMVDGSKCVGCDKTQGGDIFEAALGLACFTWGLAHGEGYCSNCGWPARGYHYKMPWPFPQSERPVGLILQYHPSALKPKPEVVHG
jgi:hypothetical protein